MNKETTLLIMAAGMGSRFGGLKQMEPIGPNGEAILDYSAIDAKNAGFNKVVFIIKKEIEKDFKELVSKRIEKIIDVDYAFQDINNLPINIDIPKERVKPWGTCHAVLAAKDIVKTPFVVINADDYYGRDAFLKMHEHLQKEEEYSMVGFNLYNTLTDNGTVTRGVCKIVDGYLTEIEEVKKIDKNSGFPKDSIVSMNMWGLQTNVFERIEKRFTDYMKNCKDYLSCEYLLPNFMDEIIKTENEKVKVLSSNDKWYGVTYKEDLPQIKSAVLNFHKQGYYK